MEEKMSEKITLEEPELRVLIESVPEETVCELVKDFEEQLATRYETIQKMAYILWEGRKDLIGMPSWLDDKWDWRTAEKLLNAYCKWHGLDHVGIF